MSNLYERDPNSEDGGLVWSEKLANEYEAANYGAGLSGYVLRQSHRIVESEFGPDRHFERVLEVGAGSGIHIRYVRHSFREYLMTDSSQSMLWAIPKDRLQSKGGEVRIAVEDATKLSLEDETIDRLIATHVLEHLYRPHQILAEWLRVLKPGGVLTLVLPCDPGLAWRLGRHLGPRRDAQRRGVDYDYVMALEHVNPIGNLLSIVRHMTRERSEFWWPLRFPSTDLNLIYGANITKAR